MKIRTCLLVACIVVVPLIAMFSHHVPPGARAAVGGFVRDLVRVPTAPGRVAIPEAVQPVAPTPLRSAEAAVPEPGAPPVVPVAATVPEAASAAESAAFGHLRALGAVAIDCRPLAGHGGHVASCRLPVDGHGQLERVFQATGADAPAAADKLLHDVTAWRRGTAKPRPDTMRF